MASAPSNDRQRVAVVTGGGGGIGAAIAEELGRTGAFVVTLDPLVSVDGSERLPSPEETTAGRIVAAGGSARASSVSVTDRSGVSGLFADLADEFGGLDAVVNVAGITRQMSYTEGSEEDWLSVLSVHLDGYRNVLDAALPLMAAAGRGHLLGVTSGSGWRPADTGAYGCAKRAVAALTWQLGRHAPPGVVVNAVSPIAMTRMVVAAMERHRAKAASEVSSTTGSLALGSLMPTPQQLGPLGAHLVGEGFAGCRGQVLFIAGSELALIDEPRLLEVLGTEGLPSLAQALELVTPGALVPAEVHQVSNGGSNPRFAPTVVATSGTTLPPSAVRSCAIVADRPGTATAVVAALDARGVPTMVVPPDGLVPGFEGAAAALASIIDANGQVDALVIALAGDRPAAGVRSEWERVLAEHEGIVDHVCADAAWARAVADHAVRTDTPMRLVTLTEAATAGGLSRAQAAAQHARSARGATGGLVVHFAVGVESHGAAAASSVGELAAHLVCSPEAPPLSGAELVVGAGTIGLRSHPRVGAGITLGGAGVPRWLDDVLDRSAR